MTSRKYLIDYTNQHGNSAPTNLTYNPCPHCVPVIRKKIFDVKDRLRFSYRDMMMFVKDNFTEGLYTGLIKNRQNSRDFNIEHTVPVSLFSPLGGRNVTDTEIPPISIEPYSDPNIMYTSFKDANTHRQNYIISDDSQYQFRGDNYGVNIYLIKSGQDMKTLYIKDYVDWINGNYKKDYNSLVSDSFNKDIRFNNANTIINIEELPNNETRFTTKDNRKITAKNSGITKINNWFMEPTCRRDYCMFQCDTDACKFDPRLHTKGDIARSFNYFQLVYGHNPHQRVFNARPDYLSTDKSYRRGMKWLGNYHASDKRCTPFNDNLWEKTYYNQLKMYMDWSNIDLPDMRERKRNELVAGRTGISNIFIGAYKDGKYIDAEYDLSRGKRHWMADLLLGRPHDCQFYQSLDVTPPKMRYLLNQPPRIDNTNHLNCN